LPLYEYQCASCGQSVEKRHGFDDKMTDKCEHCGGELKRTFSATGIVFKGSGFYVTDSRKASGSSGSTSSSGSAGSTSSAEKKPDSTSSESKTEAKSDSAAAETKSDSAKPETKKSDTAA